MYFPNYIFGLFMYVFSIYLLELK